jgi:hypothetical protein
MAFPRRDALRHTYADYLTWPEGAPFELIDGTAYIRDPQGPFRAHQEVAGAEGGRSSLLFCGPDEA